MSPPRWTDAHLDAHRALGDPPYDNVVAGLPRAKATESISPGWHALRHTDAPIGSSGASPMARPARRPPSLPTWADRQKIAAGERVFAKHGLAIVTGLFCASLPIGYSCAPPAQVLIHTGRMVVDLHARIDETAQFVFDVASPGGLTSPDARGVQACHKVRTIHAFIRRDVVEKGFDAARYGLPVNQEDLAATMLAFGHVTANVVHTLGARLDPEEREGWLHLWRVVGALLGIVEPMLPDGHADCDALYHAILRRHQEPTAAGRELTQALLAHISGYIPGRLDDAVFAELMRLFLTDPVADWMDVPRHRWARAIVGVDRRVRRVVDRVTDRSDTLAGVTGRFNLRLLRALHKADRAAKGARFRLPVSLLRRLRP